MSFLNWSRSPNIKVESTQRVCLSLKTVSNQSFSDSKNLLLRPPIFSCPHLRTSNPKKNWSLLQLWTSFLDHIFKKSSTKWGLLRIKFLFKQRSRESTSALVRREPGLRNLLRMSQSFRKTTMRHGAKLFYSQSHCNLLLRIIFKRLRALSSRLRSSSDRETRKKCRNWMKS
jgi:hypothetical protein